MFLSVRRPRTTVRHSQFYLCNIQPCKSFWDAQILKWGTLKLLKLGKFILLRLIILFFGNILQFNIAGFSCLSAGDIAVEHYTLFCIVMGAAEGSLFYEQKCRWVLGILDVLVILLAFLLTSRLTSSEPSQKKAGTPTI